MVLKSQSKYSYVTSLLILLFFCSGLFFAGCANTMAPSGGPKDSLAPIVVYMTPSFGTKNFAAKRIMIEFNEYVKLKDQQKEFYTSPLMKRKPSLMIKGRSIQVDIKDTLLENTTYSLNFGSSISDNNEDNPLNNLSYVFSTGSEIDSLVISGMTVDGYSKDSIGRAFIYFFAAHPDTLSIETLGDSIIDSIRESRTDTLGQYDSLALSDTLQHDSLMYNGSPNVVGRSEGNGLFLTKNLKPIDYLVYALFDKNGNQQYEPGVDKIGFLDSVVNPRHLPGFNVWYDTLRDYMVADPQLQIRLFSEKQNKRQNLTSFKRPEQHKIELMFGAAHPIIEELVLDNIDSSKIITEYVTTGHDTMNLWLNVAPELLPDTIKGYIKYMKHDSIGVLQLERKDLKLHWRLVETKEEIKEREKLEKEARKEQERLASDSAAGIVADGDLPEEELEPVVETNPFSYNVVEGGTTLNPLKHIEIKFDSPLVSVDTSRIRLLRLGEDEKRYIVEYKLERDSLKITTWRIKAKWLDGRDYDLLIPSGVFRNVKGFENDSLKSQFKIFDPADFATLVLDIKGVTAESSYVIQLLNSGGSVEQEIKGAKSGKHTFKYVADGFAKVRIIEDMNGNGVWDGGSLLNRVQPEKVEVWMAPNGDEEIVTKVNWENELPLIEMSDLFGPKTMGRMKRDLQLREDARLRKKALEGNKTKVRKPADQEEEEYNPAFDGANGNDRGDEFESDFGRR